MVKFIVIAFIFANCIFRVSAVPPEPAVKLRITQLPLFWAMTRGAGIYLCNVEVKEMDDSLQSNSLEVGDVSLVVKRTLFGESRKTLDLRYLVRNGGPEFRRGTPWPRFKTGDTLLCVVIGDVSESGFQESPKVWLVNQTDDPKIAAITDICELFKADQAQRVQTAISDPRREVRDFAIYKLVCGLGLQNPAGATEVLKSRIAAYQNDAGIQEALAIINIADQAFEFNPTKNALPWYYHCLYQMTQCKTASIRNKALDAIEAHIYNRSIVTSPNVFTETEKAVLRAMLADSKSNKRLGEWLAR